VFRRRVIAAAPLTTISVCNAVSLQATASKRVQNSLGDGDVRPNPTDKLQQVSGVSVLIKERHEASANRAEKRGRIGRRIVCKHQGCGRRA